MDCTEFAKTVLPAQGNILSVSLFGIFASSLTNNLGAAVRWLCFVSVLLLFLAMGAAALILQCGMKSWTRGKVAASAAIFLTVVAVVLVSTAAGIVAANAHN